MMNENAKAWVKALRSGKYRQGRGLLRQGNKFCCLGVACDLAIKAGLPGLRWVDEGERFACASPNSVFLTKSGTPGLVGSLPEEVRHWLGLRTWSGALDENRSLSSMNDAGDSFSAIADAIEENERGELFAKITRP